MAEYPLCRRGMSETEIFRELPAKNGSAPQKPRNATAFCEMRRCKLVDWRP
jgi:hypothetical protein